MSRKVFIAATASFLFAGSLAAQPATEPADVTIAEFLATYDSIDGPALRAKAESEGAEVLLENEALQSIREAMAFAATNYRARIAADREAGLAPHSCPPEEKQDLGTEDLIPHLRGYPEEQRSSLSLSAALLDLMQTRYSCS